MQGGGSASALCLDSDGDGAGTNPGNDCVLGTDCDDSDSLVNPGAMEDGIDSVDDDCDGLLVARRAYITGMDALLGTDFLLVNATATGGNARLSTSLSAASRLEFKHTLTWEQGEAHLRVAVASDGTGGVCSMYLGTTSDTTSCSGLLSAGLNDLTCTLVGPGEVVDEMDITCPAGVAGRLVVDWLTLENSDYPFAPIADLSATFTPMSMSGGGRMAMVRASEDGSMVFAGSDVAGFAWSPDGFDWTIANGQSNDIAVTGGVGVWDAWSTDGDEVFALSGDWRDGDGGGLWVSRGTTTPGEDWSEISDLGFSKHFDDCTNKSIASGRFIVPDPTEGELLLYIASQAPASRGVWVAERTSAGVDPTVCAPFAGLPEDLGGYAAIPIALATVEGSTGDYLLVGYRSVTPGDPAYDRSALYACPTVGPAGSVCTSGGVTCFPIDDADATDDEVIDVRDIAADPVEPGKFWIADGGQRADAATGLCDSSAHVESTVLLLDVDSDADGILFEAGDVDLWDTDDADADPDWAGGMTYQSECYQASAAAGGNLRPFGATGMTGEIAGVEVDPEGEFAFAWYNIGAGAAEQYACVRMYRGDAFAIRLGGTDWEPFVEWEPGAMGPNDAHATTRRGYVDAMDSWFRDEPRLEMAAPSLAHDAIFVPAAAGSRTMLVGAGVLWNLPETGGGGFAGWSSASSLLDTLAWTHGFDGTHGFGDAGGGKIASCPGCGSDGVGPIDEVQTAVGDLGGLTSYGSDSVDHLPAYRECAFGEWGSGGYDVSIRNFNDFIPYPQRWELLGDQSGTDNADYSAVLFDDGSGERCWDATAQHGAFMGKRTDLDWAMACSDQDLDADHAWIACDPTGAGSISGVDPYHLRDDQVGVPVMVAAVGWDRAVIMAADACWAYDATTGACTSSYGGGIWLAEYASDGLHYTHVPYTDPGTCDETCFFSDDPTTTAKPQPFMYLDPFSDADGTGEVTLHLTSREHGARSLSFDVNDPAGTYAWSEVCDGGITVSCVMTLNSLRGVSADPSDGRVILFGGSGANNTGVVYFDTTTSPPTADTAINPANANPNPLVGGITALLPHPHVEGLYFFGVQTDDGCSGCDAPGLWLLQRRFRPATSTYTWSFLRLSGDDLENPHALDVDWGMGDDSSTIPYLDHIYLATKGTWDGSIKW